MFGTKTKVKCVQDHLRYDPDTGHLWWTKSRSGRQRGKPAGNNKGDYIQIHLTFYEGKFTVYAHVAAHVLMTGEWPKDRVDHKDRNGLNNIWVNIRPATDSQNSCNRSKRSDNTTGYKGVSQNGKRFCARVTIKGVTNYLGTYDTKEEAFEAYQKGAKELFGEFYCDI